MNFTSAQIAAISRAAKNLSALQNHLLRQVADSGGAYASHDPATHKTAESLAQRGFITIATPPVAGLHRNTRTYIITAIGQRARLHLKPLTHAVRKDSALLRIMQNACFAKDDDYVNDAKLLHGTTSRTAKIDALIRIGYLRWDAGHHSLTDAGHDFCRNALFTPAEIVAIGAYTQYAAAHPGSYLPPDATLKKNAVKRLAKRGILHEDKQAPGHYHIAYLARHLAEVEIPPEPDGDPLPLESDLQRGAAMHIFHRATHAIIGGQEVKVGDIGFEGSTIVLTHHVSGGHVPGTLRDDLIDHIRLISPNTRILGSEIAGDNWVHAGRRGGTEIPLDHTITIRFELVDVHAAQPQPEPAAAPPLDGISAAAQPPEDDPVSEPEQDDEAVGVWAALTPAAQEALLDLYHSRDDGFRRPTADEATLRELKRRILIFRLANGDVHISHSGIQAVEAAGLADPDPDDDPDGPSVEPFPIEEDTQEMPAVQPVLEEDYIEDEALRCNACRGWGKVMVGGRFEPCFVCGGSGYRRDTRQHRDYMLTASQARRHDLADLPL